MQMEANVPQQMQLDEIEIAFRNGSLVIRSALGIEQNCAEIIGAFFIRNDPNLLNVFMDQIVHSSFFSFESKRKTIFWICEQLRILDPQDRNKFEKTFSRVIRYRNAFAHGTILQKHNEICVSYFQSSPRIENLDLAFWEGIEETFEIANIYITSIHTRIVCSENSMTAGQTDAEQGAAANP